MASKAKANRLIGIALASLSTVSMLAAPAKAASYEGSRVAFRTTTATLDYVRLQRPALFKRLLMSRSGQAVRITTAEYRYLRHADRVVSAQTRHVKPRSRSWQDPTPINPSMEFSSQSRTARAAYAQAAPAQAAPAAPARPRVVVTPDRWKALTDFWPALIAGATALTPVVPWAGMLAAIAVVINLIITAIGAVAKAWSAARALPQSR